MYSNMGSTKERNVLWAGHLYFLSLICKMGIMIVTTSGVVVRIAYNNTRKVPDIVMKCIVSKAPGLQRTWRLAGTVTELGY